MDLDRGTQNLPSRSGGIFERARRVLDMDRWEVWKARFAALARGEGTDVELAGLADGVFGEMRDIEKEER